MRSRYILEHYKPSAIVICILLLIINNWHNPKDFVRLLKNFVSTLFFAFSAGAYVLLELSYIHAACLIVFCIVNAYLCFWFWFFAQKSFCDCKYFCNLRIWMILINDPNQVKLLRFWRMSYITDIFICCVVWEFVYAHVRI